MLTQKTKKITEGCFHTADKEASTVSLFAANLCAYANQPWPRSFLCEAKHTIYRYTACMPASSQKLMLLFLKQLSHLLSL